MVATATKNDYWEGTTLRTIKLASLLLCLICTSLLSAQGHEALKFAGKRLAKRYHIAQIVSHTLVRGKIEVDKSGHGFQDVAEDFSQAVSIVTKAGVMRDHEGKFHGKKLVNRYALAITLSNLLKKFGHECNQEAKSSFKDVKQSHWARAAVEQVAKLGILQGYDGKFHGRRLLNRYQMAVVFAKIADLLNLEKTEPTIEFTDIPNKHWSYEAVQALCRVGLIKTTDKVTAR